MKTSTIKSIILLAVAGLITSGCHTQLSTVSQEIPADDKSVEFVDNEERDFRRNVYIGNHSYGRSSLFYDPFFYGFPSSLYSYFGYDYAFIYGNIYNDPIFAGAGSADEGRSSQIRSSGLYSRNDRSDRIRPSDRNKIRYERSVSSSESRSRTSATVRETSDIAAVIDGETRSVTQTRERNSSNNSAARKRSNSQISSNEDGILRSRRYSFPKNKSSRSYESFDPEEIATTHREIDSAIHSDRINNAFRSITTENTRTVSSPSEDYVRNFNGRRMYVSYNSFLNSDSPVEIFRAGRSGRSSYSYQSSRNRSTVSRSHSRINRSSSGTRNSGAAVTRTRSSSKSSSSGTRSRSSSSEKKNRSSGSNN